MADKVAEVLGEMEPSSKGYGILKETKYKPVDSIREDQLKGFHVEDPNAGSRVKKEEEPSFLDVEDEQGKPLVGGMTFENPEDDPRNNKG